MLASAAGEGVERKIYSMYPRFRLYEQTDALSGVGEPSASAKALTLLGTIGFVQILRCDVMH